MVTHACIRYQDGYKYQLEEDFALAIPIRPAAAVEHRYFSLSLSGDLLVRAGYAWDGPSGPTIDTRDFMRGSLVHDVLYQMIREGFLAIEPHRRMADELLRTLCQEDGMGRIRSAYVYYGVRWFAAGAALAASERHDLWAPAEPERPMTAGGGGR